MSERPRVYKTDGAILRRRNSGEGDSILTVFAEESGKFQAVARGVRKPRSKMRGHVEPFMCTQFLFAHGRTFDVVTQAEVIRPYLTIRDDLDLTALAFYCVELVDRFTAERLPQPGVFAMLISVLDAIEITGSVLAVRHFELALLAFMGYEVRLDRCAICAGKLDEEPAFFSPQSGGMICPNCVGAAGAGRIASVRAIKALRFAARSDLAQFVALRVEEPLARELEMLLGDFVTWTLEREMLTRRHIETLRRLDA